MSKYAIVIDNLVVNIVKADSPLEENWISIDGLIPQPGIGWGYTGSSFISPAEPQPAVYYSLNPRSFWKRFLVSEREALQNILATGTQTQKNKLNAFREYITTGGNVELIDDYIINSVNLMQTAGIIAAGRANTILNTPILQSET
jgi:hypothetical protein